MKMASPKTFSTWYTDKFGQLNIGVQAVLWLFYGFIWIPIYYIMSEVSQTNLSVEDIEKLEESRREKQEQKSILLEKVITFIEWNKKNWNSGGKNRWKVIGLWVFIFAILGHGSNHESSHLGHGSNHESSQDNKEPSEKQISNISWEEVDQIYNINSDVSECIRATKGREMEKS
jgi:hypothetical protein